MSLCHRLAREEKLDGARTCVRVRLASDEFDSCVVELSFLRSFQRRRRCRDRSLGAADPRVAVCPFGDESASWQSGDQISNRDNAGDS